MYHVTPLGDYLSSFHQLENLTLSTMNLHSEIFQQVESLSAFRHTLSLLTLMGCHTSSRALIIIVNCFPNLVDLQISDIVYMAGGGPMPSISRPLRGRLVVDRFGGIGDISTLNPLSELRPELDELIVYGHPLIPDAYNSVVAACAGSVKRLRLLRGCRGKP